MAQFLRVAGQSGSGKTTLILQLLDIFHAKGISTACLKHSHHPLSLPEKDSTRLFEKSTHGSLVLGKDATSITLPVDHRTPKEWAEFLFPNTELILVEGWRSVSLPTIIILPIDDAEWKIPRDIIASFGRANKLAVPFFTTPETLADFILSKRRSEEPPSIPKP